MSYYPPIPMEKLEAALADIRDMFPIPECGSPLEQNGVMQCLAHVLFQLMYRLALIRM